MKQTIYIISIILLGCSAGKIKNIIPVPTDSLNQKVDSTIINYKLLDKVGLVSDFTGDGQKETLFQNNISHVTGLQIDSFPDPYENEWETVVKYMFDLESDITLALSSGEGDTLHLGSGLGLYCLLDLGDINHDKKSEIAFVIDACDFSRVNTCLIYTLCNNKWTELKSFGIHEDAFDYTTDSAPTFIEIKDFLEYKNKKWMFKDYNQNDYDSPDDVGKMKPLKLKGC